MKTERFFDMLLSFGSDWRVDEVIEDTVGIKVDIYLSYCGKEPPYDYAPVRCWRHLDTMQYKSYIHARLPRFRTVDGKVTTLVPPWADKHERQTYLFEAVVIDTLLATTNQSKTASLMKCSFEVVNRIMHRASERGQRRRHASQALRHLSIDEKSFKKGHQYVTVLSDPVGGQVLDVAEGRTKDSCEKLIDNALTVWQRSQVESISMDMWKAFLRAAQQKLPQAKIIHDKFHLIAYLNKAIDKVRRKEVKRHPELKNSRYALLKNTENLTQKQRAKFDAIRQANYQVSKAWQVRENFKDAFGNDTAAQGRAIFEEWFFTALQCGIKEVVEVAIMFSDHINGIINAMTSTLNNAMAERLNGKIQLLKATARGYRSFQHFRNAILFFYGKLNLYPLNSR